MVEKLMALVGQVDPAALGVRERCALLGLLRQSLGVDAAIPADDAPV